MLSNFRKKTFSLFSACSRNQRQATTNQRRIHQRFGKEIQNHGRRVEKGRKK